MLVELVPHRRLRPFLLVPHRQLAEVQWVNRNVSDHSKLSTVVQVLILQSKEIPNETPEARKNVASSTIMEVGVAECTTLTRVPAEMDMNPA